MDAVEKWLEEMKSIWLEKRPGDMRSILADPLEYYETPFMPPLTSIDDVILEWQEIHNQDIDHVNMDLLHSDGMTGFAQWTFKQNNEPLHVGAYFIKLNNEGKCTHFRQWWNTDLC